MLFVKEVQDSLVRELIDDFAEIDVSQKVTGLELIHQWVKIWFARKLPG